MITETIDFVYLDGIGLIDVSVEMCEYVWGKQNLIQPDEDNARLDVL